MSEAAEDRLMQAGVALHEAWQRDAQRLRRTRHRRRVFAVAVAGAIALTSGVAIAASFLKSSADEQAGLREANTLFAGSSPKCVLTSEASFRCTLDEPPTGETFYDSTGNQLLNVFLGMKMPTVDAAGRVDGGCIAQSADGMVWDCYLGQEAVSRGAVSQQLLGQASRGPAAG